jgi:hypothetical protein
VEQPTLSGEERELLSFTADLARRHIERIGGFYPFGVTWTGGDRKEVDVAGEAADPMPILVAALRERAKDPQSRCLVSCANVEMAPDRAVDPTTGQTRGCIWLHFESNSGVALDIWQPYVISPTGSVALETENSARGVLQYFQRSVGQRLKAFLSGRS